MYISAHKQLGIVMSFFTIFTPPISLISVSLSQKDTNTIGRIGECTTSTNLFNFLSEQYAVSESLTLKSNIEP